MVVVLPEPFTPTTRMTNGFARRIDDQRLCDGREHLLDFGRQDRLHFGVAHLLVVAPFADRGRDARRDIHAEVGADQQFLQFLDRRGIELALRHEIGDRAADRGRGALQPAREALPPALFGGVIHVCAP